MPARRLKYKKESGCFGCCRDPEPLNSRNNTGELMIKNIPVVILCGGMGSRLAEYTEVHPKPLVEIGGKPIL